MKRINGKWYERVATSQVQTDEKNQYLFDREFPGLTRDDILLLDDNEKKAECWRLVPEVVSTTRCDCDDPTHDHSFGEIE